MTDVSSISNEEAFSQIFEINHQKDGDKEAREVTGKPCSSTQEVDQALESIAQEDVDERMELYVELAQENKDRAHDILKRAEADLLTLSLEDQGEAILELSPLYVQCKNGEGLKALTPKLEAAIDKDIEDLKKMKTFALSYHSATIALAEEDKQAFEKHLASLKESLSSWDDSTAEDLQEVLEELKDLEEKAFPTDPMVLKEQKV